MLDLGIECTFRSGLRCSANTILDKGLVFFITDDISGGSHVLYVEQAHEKMGINGGRELEWLAEDYRAEMIVASELKAEDDYTLGVNYDIEFLRS